MATSFGCSHYKRRCSFLTPCCNQIYPCRHCHDETENHVLNRRAIKEVICRVCLNPQAVSTNCKFCGIKFGNYTCLECNMFDDNDKGQFHCLDCGLCRVGGARNFFHCETCNMCLNISFLGTHKCIENRSHTDCPICSEDLHSSTIELHVPKCGHLLHKPCLEKMQNSGHKSCPTCRAAF